MNVQIDQSNKVEQTERDTVIALSNGIKFTVMIRAKDKRALQEGKGSPAHKLAGRVTARKQNPDLRVTAEEVMKVLFPKKKTRHPEGSRSV